jgi:hypothetical protein
MKPAGKQQGMAFGRHDGSGTGEGRMKPAGKQQGMAFGRHDGSGTGEGRMNRRAGAGAGHADGMREEA